MRYQLRIVAGPPRRLVGFHLRAEAIWRHRALDAERPMAVALGEGRKAIPESQTGLPVSVAHRARGPS